MVQAVLNSVSLAKMFAMLEEKWKAPGIKVFLNEGCRHDIDGFSYPIECRASDLLYHPYSKMLLINPFLRMYLKTKMKTEHT